MGGRWSLATPLNLILINPFDTPTFKWRGAMLAGMATSKAWEMVREGASCANIPPSAMGVEDSGLTPGSWREGLHMVAVWAWQHLLVGGWAVEIGEWDRAPLRSLYKPSASDSTTAISTFWRLGISRCWASSFNILAWHNKCRPRKRKKGLSQRSGLATKPAKEQSERSSDTKKKRKKNIPHLAIPEPHFWLRPVPPCLHPGAGPIYFILFLGIHLRFTLLRWLICTWDNPRWTKGIWLEDLISRCFDQMDHLILKKKKGVIPELGGFTQSCNDLPLQFLHWFSWTYHLL